jgi:hypothetical protein
MNTSYCNRVEGQEIGTVINIANSNMKQKKSWPDQDFAKCVDDLTKVEKQYGTKNMDQGSTKSGSHIGN